MYTIYFLILIFVSILLVIKYILDNRIKNKLIEKGLVDENVKYLYGNRFEGSGLSSLKWGIVLTGIGLAPVVGLLVPVHTKEIRQVVTVSAMFFLAGVGLIIYYFISKKLSSQAEDEDKSKK